MQSKWFIGCVGFYRDFLSIVHMPHPPTFLCVEMKYPGGKDRLTCTMCISCPHFNNINYFNVFYNLTFKQRADVQKTSPALTWYIVTFSGLNYYVIL